MLEICRLANLDTSAECLSVSDIFLKSKEKTRTFALSEIIMRTVCNRAIMAAVVDPDDWNAKWSSLQSSVQVTGAAELGNSAASQCITPGIVRGQG